MELEQLINLINNSRPELKAFGCTTEMIDVYIDNVGDGYEPDAYTDITLVELAEDIQTAYDNL